MRLYLDCDGVLADFDTAFEERFGHAPMDYEKRKGSQIFWRDIRSEAPNFYRELPLMADAMELFFAVEHLRPVILTGCPRGGWAEMQKLAWGAEHFEGIPMVVCKSRDKRDYCHQGDILIDDRLHYADLWREAGGIFIHHQNAKTSLDALSQLQPI